MAAPGTRRDSRRGYWLGSAGMGRGIGGFAAACLILVAGSTVQVVPGWAQSREVLIGTTTTRPSRDEAGAMAAVRLLEEGLRAIETGDVMLGRRRLEVLVERYPETLAATTARKTLGGLYREQFPQPPSAQWERQDPRLIPAQQDERAVPQSRGAESNAGEPPAARRDAAQLDRLRQLQDERRLQALSEDFQVTAGDRVFFAETSADLGSRARTVLSAQARWLKRHPEVPAVVEGHADDQGTREQDAALAERRAVAVRDRLLEEGVEPGRIVMRAFGRDRPVANCAAPECAVQNRRAVTVLGQDASSSRGRGEIPGLATAPRAVPPRRSD